MSNLAPLTPTSQSESPTLTAPTWRELLAAEREAQYFKDLISFIESERRAGKTIYPPNKDIFNAIALTPFAEVNVVILGQDPYHGPNQAHGLCFSVLPPTPPPPSLQNIFKELKSDLNCTIPNHGNLESWAKQGVLLLNAVLTVEAGNANSHANRGWERFTDAVIKTVNDHRSGVVFLLWGSPAQKKAALVDGQKHHILKAPHPSPLSASRGFFGCRHFSQTNQLLRAAGKGEINWQI
jgi:uracil-DNA glycosylase